MSMEGKSNVQLTSDAKWEAYEKEFSRSEWVLARKIQAGEVYVQCLEDEHGNPESIKIFEKDGAQNGKLVFFETIKMPSQGFKATRAANF